MKLSQWAKSKGVSYLTAYRMHRNGTLSSEILPTGTIIVNEQKPLTNKIALYARVSSHDQKADLVRQLQRLRDFVAGQGLAVSKEITELGSGLNGKRTKLLSLLADSTITTIVVEHRDRLARFGVEYIETILKASGRNLIVINKSEYKEDIVQDFVDLATSMCAKIYGRRSAKNRAKRIIEVMSETDSVN